MSSSPLRLLAGALSLSRVGFGAVMVARPQDAAGLSWITRRQARKPVVRVFARAQGARDAAIALGALAALRHPEQDPRPWMLAQAAGDAADLAATLASRGALPRRRSAFAATAAAGSLAISLAAGARLAPPPGQGPTGGA